MRQLALGNPAAGPSDPFETWVQSSLRQIERASFIQEGLSGNLDLRGNKLIDSVNDPPTGLNTFFDIGHGSITLGAGDSNLTFWGSDAGFAGAGFYWGKNTVSKWPFLELRSMATGGAGPQVYFEYYPQDPTTGANLSCNVNDYVGLIAFYGHNSSLGLVNFAEIDGYCTDVTAGSEAGSLKLSVLAAGSGLSMLTLGAPAATTTSGEYGAILDVGSIDWSTFEIRGHGPSEGPILSTWHDCASPYVGEEIFQHVYFGRNSAGSIYRYGQTNIVLTDVTAGSEAAQLVFYASVAGTRPQIGIWGAGLQVGSPTGGDKGLGTLNAAGNYYQNAVQVPRIKLIQATRDMTAATGNVGYTGVGFSPRMIIVFAGAYAVQGSSWGITDGTNQSVSYQWYSGEGIFAQTGEIISIYQALGLNQTASIVSLDTDGFTLSWTENGSPAADTIELAFFCIA